MECPICKIDIGDANFCPDCEGANTTVNLSRDEPQDASVSIDLPEAGFTGSNNDVPKTTDEESRGVLFETNDAEIENQIGKQYNYFFGPEGTSTERRQEHHLYTDTYQLGEAPASVPTCLLKEIDAELRKLEDVHVLIIGCASSEIAVGAAHALIGSLGIFERRQRRGFNIRDETQDGFDISIESFLPEEEEEDGKRSAVIVDARSESGQSFAISLIGDSMARGRLKQSKVYLLFTVTPPYVDGIRYQSTWKISYLDCLLKSHFPTKHSELKSKIEKQADLGWWNPDESKLCYEVKDYIDEGRLLDEIDKRTGVPPPPLPPESVFIDEEHIEKTVVYVATYFPDLSPTEFCETVEAILPDREVGGSIPDLKNNEAAEERVASQQNGQRIVEIWRDYKDTFIWRHLRETLSHDEIRVLDFANPRARDSIKSYLDRSRRYYVKDQFNILLQKGFLFHPSTRVSENMIRLTAENAVAYPDEFSKDWLVEIIKNLHERYHPDRNGARQRENPLFYFLDRVRFNNEGRGYSRIAELIRTLIKVPQKADMVNRCLADLMRLKRYDAVLNIIKRLRFADEFDGLYWLKQLFDRRVDRRDATDIRPQAFNYLYYTLKEANGDIHRTLDKLDSWLPEANTDRRGYSGSAYFALRLFIKYCFETIDRFDENDASASIEFPLFNLPADTTNEEESRLINRLVRWLLHPALTGSLRVSQTESWMKRLPEVADDRKRANQLIAILLAEWSVIVPDRRQPPTINEYDTKLETTASDRIRTVFDQFLTRVASQLSDEQRKDLITYWDESNRRSLFSPTNAAAPQLAARRNHEADRWYRVFSLGQEFRNITSSTNVT